MREVVDGSLDAPPLDGAAGADLDEATRAELEFVAEVEEVVGHRFKDPSLVSLAFRHASVTESRLDSNERLEFLGDAVLGMIVCERIFQRYPSALEGEMTKIKSLAVSRNTCAKLARELGLESFISVGKGMRTQEDLPPSLAAAVLESTVAALYLDGGMDAVCEFLNPLIDPLITDAVRSGHQHNFKSVLQQHAQQVCGCAPQYRILDEKGPDHAKAFRIAVELAGQVFESSWGQSKKQAEQQAALRALESLGLVEDDDDGMTRMVSARARARQNGTVDTPEE